MGSAGLHDGLHGGDAGAEDGARDRRADVEPGETFGEVEAALVELEGGDLEVAEFGDGVLAALVARAEAFDVEARDTGAGFGDDGGEAAGLAFEAGGLAREFGDAGGLHEAAVEEGGDVGEFVLHEGELAEGRGALGLRPFDLGFDLDLLFGDLVAFLRERGAAGVEERLLARDLVGHVLGRDEGEGGGAGEVGRLRAVAFGFEPGAADVDLGELPFDDGEFGAEERAVEADEDLALIDAVAVAGEDLADDAAVGVLDDLPVACDLDHAARDDGAGDLGRRRSMRRGRPRGARWRRSRRSGGGGRSMCGVRSWAVL